MQYDALPEELRSLPNYVVWKLVERENEKATKVPYDAKTGQLASVSNKDTWSTFEQACAVAHNVSGIGLVLDGSGHTCIDLDATDDTELQAKQRRIAEAFQSYAEISQSGKGLHIWCKGTVPCGRRKGPIEVYSTGRYMVMTGNVWRNAQVNDCQDLLMRLWEELGEDRSEPLNFNDAKETQSDYDILKVASEAINGDKFIALYEGRWEQFYPSQSEADFAIVDIISFYTQNRNQITRIFRASALGKRAKAQRNDYVNKMIQRSFDRQPAPINFDSLRNQLEMQLANIKQAEAVYIKKEESVITFNSNSIFTPPKGLVGELAKFIYSASPLPVPEISISAALALMAGVCGRCYNVSGSGINQYLLLLANTGTGKDFIGDGIDIIMEHVAKTVPAAMEFVGPGEIASPQALIKYMSKTSPSFVSVAGEFGLLLKQITAARANNNEIGLRRVLLQLYGKSGEGKSFKPRIYADSEKNTKILHNPAFSMIGEGTPEQFYEIMNEEMIHSGLLPRFTIIEYNGPRVEFNENHLTAKPDPRLIEQFAQLCAYALTLNNGNNVLHITLNGKAKELFKKFNDKCNKAINASTTETSRHLWNRGNLKALRLAGLLAVGSNYINPVIDEDHAVWAIRIIETDITNLLKKFETGEIGEPQVQNEQLKDIQKAFRRYVTEDWEKLSKYPGATQVTHFAKVIPHSFLTAYCRGRVSFKKDKTGPVNAIRNVIQSLIDSGDIQEVSNVDKQKQSLPKHGKLYIITNPKFIGKG